MHYKTNRLNHDFQIAYFIAGSCHTPDAAYAILCDLRDDRADALKNLKGSLLRADAKRVRAERALKSEDESVRLEAQADLADLEAGQETSKKNSEAARKELAFIEKCMDAIEPLRKFKHLPLAEAHEQAQQEEWKRELICRAENSLLTTGTIPTDHFATMRLHPEFLTAILPAVDEIRTLLSEPAGAAKLLSRNSGQGFDLPKLLGLPSGTKVLGKKF